MTTEPRHDLSHSGRISQHMEQMTKVSGELKVQVDSIDKELATLRRTTPDDTAIRALEQRSKLFWGAALIMGMINDIPGYLASKLARCSKMPYRLQAA